MNLCSTMCRHSSSNALSARCRLSCRHQLHMLRMSIAGYRSVAFSVCRWDAQDTCLHSEQFCWLRKATALLSSERLAQPIASQQATGQSQIRFASELSQIWSHELPPNMEAQNKSHRGLEGPPCLKHTFAATLAQLTAMTTPC